MPRYNVEYQGKWRCFSSVSEEFITKPMAEHEYEKWRQGQYGTDCGPVRKANIMEMQEAVEMLCLNHTPEQVMKELRYTGIDPSPWAELIKKANTEA